MARTVTSAAGAVTAGDGRAQLVVRRALGVVVDDDEPLVEAGAALERGQAGHGVLGVAVVEDDRGDPRIAEHVGSPTGVSRAGSPRVTGSDRRGPPSQANAAQSVVGPSSG